MEKETTEKIVHFDLCALKAARMKTEKKIKMKRKWRRAKKNGMTMKENSPLYWNSLRTNQIYTMYKLYTLSCVKREKKTGVMFKTATSLPIFVLVIHNTFAVAFVRMWMYTHHFNILRIHATNYLCDTDGIDTPPQIAHTKLYKRRKAHEYMLRLKERRKDREREREKRTHTNRVSRIHTEAVRQRIKHTVTLIWTHTQTVWCFISTLNTGRINTFK